MSRAHTYVLPAVFGVFASLSWACATGTSESPYTTVGLDGAPGDTFAPKSGDAASGDAGPADAGGLPDSVAPAVDSAPLPESAPTPTPDATTVDSAAPPDTATADVAPSVDSSLEEDAATGLSPGLGLPAASGAPCTTPGSENQCPALEVCRIATPTGGRCEGCTSCNNLGKPCSLSSDCDILFQCYDGQCANICPLGTNYCGPVTNCHNVGNATYGVCLPQ